CRGSKLSHHDGARGCDRLAAPVLNAKDVTSGAQRANGERETCTRPPRNAFPQYEPPGDIEHRKRTRGSDERALRKPEHRLRVAWSRLHAAVEYLRLQRPEVGRGSCAAFEH